MISTARSVPRAETRAEGERSHLLSLDGLRGLAIVLVVVHNAAALQTTADTLFLKGVLATHGLGWIGVQLFFVLSGFLITGILVDTKGAKRFYSAFYARRALRIFPLYYALLFAWLVVLPLLSSHVAEIAVPRSNQVWYWAYLSNWVQPYGKEIGGLPHFWSLAVEEQFYLVWPACVALLRPRALLRVSLALIVVALVVRIGLRVAHAPYLTSYMFTFARMDALALGAVIALVIRDEKLRARLVPRLSVLTWVSVIGLLAIAVISRGFRSDDGFVQTLGFSLLALGSGILVSRCAIGSGVDGSKGRLVRIFESSSLRLIGRYSYGLYVFHMPIVALLRHRAEASINHGITLHRMAALAAFVGVVSVLSLIAAVASYELVERHCLALKRYFVAKPTTYGGAPHSPNV